MANLKGINVAGTIVPYTEKDNYPTHYAKYGHGGYRTVKSINDLNNIRTTYLEEGMLAYVIDLDKIYIYKQNSWEALNINNSQEGQGGSGIQGPAGGSGAQGIQGVTGPRGATGLRGATGPRGPQGVTGPKGVTGPQGVTGPAGGSTVRLPIDVTNCNSASSPAMLNNASEGENVVLLYNQYIGTNITWTITNKGDEYIKMPNTILEAAEFAQASDINLKNIKSEISLEKCYDLINNCNPILYTLKNDIKQRNKIGLIAQEVEQYFPEIVFEDSNGYKCISYQTLAVICLKLIKNLSDQLIQLKNNLTS